MVSEQNLNSKSGYKINIVKLLLNKEDFLIFDIK